MDKVEKIGFAIASAFGVMGGAMGWLLGGFDQLIVTLLILMVLDFVSRIMVSIYNKKLDSKLCSKGIPKKLIMLIVVAMACVTQRIISTSLPIREIVICFYIANEGLSIIENAGEVDVLVPDRIKQYFSQLKKKGES